MCDIRHHGDVMDLQVSLCNIQKLTFKKLRVIFTLRDVKDLKVCLVSPQVYKKLSSL